MEGLLYILYVLGILYLFITQNDYLIISFSFFVILNNFPLHL